MLIIRIIRIIIVILIMMNCFPFSVNLVQLLPSPGFWVGLVATAEYLNSCGTPNAQMPCKISELAEALRRLKAPGFLRSQEFLVLNG
jgi:hypothetical protein